MYLIHKRELVVTLHRAYDLVPRQDGSARNPYVKFFLLPDRSEKSRRQSVALAETLMPVWNEPFYYYDLTEPMLMSRVLEVTVWDYDKYEANSFLGETLIDLSQTPLENQPFSYSLLDMDDENPLRLRLRQRRYSSQTPPIRSRSQTSHYNTPPSIPRHGVDEYLDSSYPSQNQAYYNDYNSRRSRPSDRSAVYRGAAGTFAEQPIDDWNKNSAIGSGYLSDHGQYSQMGSSRSHHRRPKSATALRNVAEVEDSDHSYAGQSSAYLNDMDQGYSDRNVRDRHSGANDYNASVPLANGRTRGRRTRQEVLQEQSVTGYGSDGGSETLSVNSAQSMNR
jgi:hypothetical protein